jgi:hypothetical protein
LQTEFEKNVKSTFDKALASGKRWLRDESRGKHSGRDAHNFAARKLKTLSQEVREHFRARRWKCRGTESKRYDA